MIQYLVLALFVGYLFGIGTLVKRGLVNFFKFANTLSTTIVGAFFAFSILSWLLGISVVFYKLTYPVISAALGLTAFICFALYLWAKKYEELSSQDNNLSDSSFKISYKSIILFIVFSASILYGFFLLYISKSNTSLLSPWQTINPQFIFIYFISILSLAFLILWKFPAKYTFWLIVALSLLQHSYLPLTSELFYGADGWRHIAAEDRVVREVNLPSPTISDATVTTVISNYVGRFAYSQLWGVSAFLAKVGDIGLIEINRWLLPILWSVILPILLYEIAKSFGFKNRRSLTFTWLSFLPFAWQAAGGFTLPVNFGFLIWIFALLLIFKRAENPESEQIFLLIFLGVILSFGYTLYAFLFWGSFIIFELIHWKMEFTWTEVGIMVLLVAIFLPLVEWKFGYGGLQPAVSIWDGTKQLFGSMFGYYFASGPRPHDISAGNIILNQTPSYAYVANLFTSARWWLVLFLGGFWSLFIYGVYVSLKRGYISLPDFPGDPRVNVYRSHYCWLFTVGIGLLVGYVVSRFFLPGEHLLTRRLDVVLAFFILLSVFIALTDIYFITQYKYIAVFGLVVFALFATASYSLGPDTNSVSSDEYSAMHYIAANELKNEKHCIVAKTFPLLALESISGGDIVGGGFPISHNFEQPELSELQMNLNDISILDANKALKVTGAKNCWLVAKTGGLISNYIKSSGAVSSTFGTITLWNYSH